jgi:hypothetical protein
MRGLILVKQDKQGNGLAYAKPFHEAAKKVDGVVDSFPVFGRFDDVVFLEARDYEALLGLAGRIGAIPGVKSTETLPEGA